MSFRLKRLEALERRKPSVFRPFDYAAAAAALRWHIASAEAVASGKASAVPRFGPWPAPSDAKRAALQLLEQTAARLASKPAG
jgi:hypothetical protein